MTSFIPHVYANTDLGIQHEDFCLINASSFCFVDANLIVFGSVEILSNAYLSVVFTTDYSVMASFVCSFDCIPNDVVRAPHNIKFIEHLPEVSVSFVASSAFEAYAIVQKPRAIKSIEYIPEALRQKEFWMEMCDNLDYVLNNAIRNANEVRYKYEFLSNVDKSVIDTVIRECGYGYIADILSSFEEYPANAFGYVFLLHFLKGSKKGLELVLDLFGIPFYSVKEWYEYDFPILPNTYLIFVDSSRIDFNVLKKLAPFLKSYVQSVPFIVDINTNIKIDYDYNGYVEHVYGDFVLGDLQINYFSLSDICAVQVDGMYICLPES